jgi:spermidine/putrescine ABC transporter ATP-binding subunit
MDMSAGADLALPALPPRGAALQLDRVSRLYADGTHAVRDVSLSVPAGRILTLLGPSGSGKTTTLKMIAGFEIPDSGTITLAGRDISRIPPHARDLGMVFQNYALFPHMNVFENVAFPLRMRRRSRADIETAVRDALALVHLEGFEARLPRQLSGGQQQRVALARAIVFRPPLLLMDEPLGALDRQLRKSVQSELKRIQRQLGLTIVYVTHDQDEAMFLSDEIAIVQDGRIVQCGPPEALYDAPGSVFVASFLGESHFLAGIVADVTPGLASVTLPNGWQVKGKPAAALVAGQAASILVRPEKLHVYGGSSAFEPHPNVLPGHIDLVNFLGSAMEYEIDLAGARLTARVTLRAAAQSFAIGDPVQLHFAPEDCLVFPSP